MAKSKKQKDPDDLQDIAVFGSDDMELNCKHCDAPYILSKGYSEKYCSKECAEADMAKVIPYSVGVVSASVCADNSLTPDEVEKEFNRISPSGTTMGWKISEDAHFRQGATNPCPCDKFPETRKHYLFNC